MKKALLPLAVAVTALLWTSGCKKDEDPQPVDLGHAYFPTDTGRWVDFAVDTVWRNDLSGVPENACTYEHLSIRTHLDPEHRSSEAEVNKCIYNRFSGFFKCTERPWSLKLNSHSFKLFSKLLKDTCRSFL